MFIIFRFQFFHTITIDFIFVLFGEFNSLFIRKIVFIPKKFTYNVNQGVNALLDRLLITNWNISTVIISDRDLKNSEMWQIFFQRMGIKLFIFIVYHPQTDKISTRTNHTVEIIIRLFVINYPDINFVLIFPFFQTQFNNSFNAVTGLSANEFNYGFKMHETFSNLTEPKISDLPAQRLKYRQKIANVSAFVNVKTKIYYDARHLPLLINVGDRTYLKLHHGYELPDRFNKKIFQQRCGPFKIVKRIKQLICELV